LEKDEIDFKFGRGVEIIDRSAQLPNWALPVFA